ncbi:transcription factor bHLH162-like [Abrus precatorius]|uniref:Transcription factor bHLH162-like n=1 Tax=Abrus precatorius TaxID=3816 RepID=A0A8B8KJ80_ABRPR|nr:transcription factor bHLH162-like [Abrus precatorius]
MDNQQRDPSAKGIERKIIEKNRRNQMKKLCSELNSLLPANNNLKASSRSRPLSLFLSIDILGESSRADQIDEAICYIKSLETKVKIAQEKKESLVKGKRSRSHDSSSGSEVPKIEIHQMASSLIIILMCGFNDQFIFTEIIRILHEENIEVKSAHSSRAGNSMQHVVHIEIQQSFQGGKTALNERLKRFVLDNENFLARRIASPFFSPRSG